MSPALGEPVVEQAGRHAQLGGGAGPARQHLELDGAVRWPEVPVGTALVDCETLGTQAIGRGDRRAGSERRAEPLVPELVEVDRSDDSLVVTAGRRQADTAVIAQRRIEGTPADREDRDQPIQPFHRHQIEQRRHGHEVGVVTERPPQIGSEIDLDGRHLAQGRRGVVGGLKQRGIVVEEAPVLTRRQQRRHRAHGRAGAAAEIGDAHRSVSRKRLPDRIEHGPVARRLVIGLTQRQPLCGKTHTTAVSTRRNTRAVVSQSGNCTAAARAAAA